jgi:hypothetical protein
MLPTLALRFIFTPASAATVNQACLGWKVTLEKKKKALVEMETECPPNMEYKVKSATGRLYARIYPGTAVLDDALDVQASAGPASNDTSPD